MTFVNSNCNKWDFFVCEMTSVQIMTDNCGTQRQLFLTVASLADGLAN